jgi:hypothetical protein
VFILKSVACLGTTEIIETVCVPAPGVVSEIVDFKPIP